MDFEDQFVDLPLCSGGPNPETCYFRCGFVCAEQRGIITSLYLLAVIFLIQPIQLTHTRYRTLHFLLNFMRFLSADSPSLVRSS